MSKKRNELRIPDSIRFLFVENTGFASQLNLQAIAFKQFIKSKKSNNEKSIPQHGAASK